MWLDKLVVPLLPVHLISIPHGTFLPPLSTSAVHLTLHPLSSGLNSYIIFQIHDLFFLLPPGGGTILTVVVVACRFQTLGKRIALGGGDRVLSGGLMLR